MMGLPNFIIVGAARSGTTSIYAWLKQHPSVFMSPIKEPAYFVFGEDGDLYRGKKPDRYLTRWDDYRKLFHGSDHYSVAGEASTLYHHADGAAQRIRQSLGPIKIVMILRDPVERAYSHYCLHRCTGLEPCETFVDAISAWDERRAIGWMPNWDYVSAGLYADHLHRYQDLFGRQNVKVLLFDELSDRPAAIMRELCEFLAIDSTFEFDTSIKHNPTSLPKCDFASSLFFSNIRALTSIGRVLPHPLRSRIGNKIKDATSSKRTISSEERRAVGRLFAADILNLETMIDHDLSSWSGVIRHQTLRETVISGMQ